MNANEEASAMRNAANMESQQQQQQRQAEMQQQKEAMEERRRVAVRSMMEPEALERLNRIGLVKPEKQRAVENLIIQSAQSGRLQQRIDEGTLVELLEHVEKQNGSASNIKFARKAFDDDDDSDIDLDNLE
ncbi:Programmed cell death protein, putative [Perkinsus marinus ATCC 50983]|uniref:Programmed cell death protein, putative n=1 Tax=Perkinsus marinus (strain ATCC 50983 / TXsc) TaxID=423536 RepID=C5K8T4_PERM5|nr:Programmed cell death protein, putative [Perkinsus marinus ATCC 50983]EER19108.1 Programmed cell death protein, putative [Perkinsus marinus ATCC 50983]|eukprot:XP_002787312.1 Programmed cell death protein, putative [Perkinsus marinus ATCC 50983]